MSNSQNSQFYKSDLDPMTLVLKLDLDMVKMYHHTKNEVSLSRHSKVIACTDRQTHRQYENITFPHTQAVINKNFNTHTKENYQKKMLLILVIYEILGCPTQNLYTGKVLSFLKPNFQQKSKTLCKTAYHGLLWTRCKNT